MRLRITYNLFCWSGHLIHQSPIQSKLDSARRFGKAESVTEELKTELSLTPIKLSLLLLKNFLQSPCDYV